MGQTYPYVVETFSNPDHQIRLCVSEYPSISNGVVNNRRYRITVELVDDPVEVLAESLRGMWRRSTNHHEWGPLRKEAAKLGIVLDDLERGKDGGS